MKKNNNNIRLRFAPSPTGFLHIGSLRTALFGYLIAKSLGGKFILRIEDTDQKREVAGAADKLVLVLEKMGITFDEGPHLDGSFGPYTQTERLNIYQKYANELLQTNKVYRCFCTEERLQIMRAEQEANKQAPRYDRHCRDLTEAEVQTKIKAGEKFVIRQKMPLTGEVTVYDELRGHIKFPAADLDDQILIKSSGVPTYQLANVVDDHLMEISHVTRAVEWLPSYPKNALLYQDFGWTPPKFIHLPLILNKEGGGKLSKRRGDVFVEDYLNKGYLPEALINFCVLLGWHPKSNQEIWSLTELEDGFCIDGLGASPAVFDLEKLDYYNSYYIRQKSLSDLTTLCAPYLQAAGQEITDRKYLEKIISLAQNHLKKLSDVVSVTNFLVNLPSYDQELLRWKSLTIQKSLNNLKEIKKELEKIETEDWTKEYLEKNILAWIINNGYKNGDYLWPLRVALSGQKNSPSPFEIAWALGKIETLNRIDSAINP